MSTHGIRFRARGMYRSRCERMIENSVCKLAGVQRVKAAKGVWRHRHPSWSHEDQSEIDLDEIRLQVGIHFNPPIPHDTKSSRSNEQG